jgi:hypothetical protein
MTPEEIGINHIDTLINLYEFKIHTIENNLEDATDYDMIKCVAYQEIINDLESLKATLTQ